MFEPVQARFRDLRSSGDLERVLAAGAEKAAGVAETTLHQVKDRVGFVVPKR